jgi:hypothetical protein
MHRRHVPTAYRPTRLHDRRLTIPGIQAMRSSPLLCLACLVVAGSAMVGGCGGGPIELEDSSGEAERAQCESDVHCGISPDLETCLATSFREREDTFRSLTLSDPVNAGTIKSLTNAVNAGTIEYHGDLARQCVDLLAGERCTTWDLVDFHHAAVDLCLPVFEGKVAEGGRCVIEDECVGDGLCLTDPCCTMACCAGACGPPRQLLPPIGAECSWWNGCGEGAWCRLDAGGGMYVCTALIASGGACEDYASCARPNLCDIDIASGMGTCRLPPDTGEACDPERLSCKDGRDYCNTQTLVCTRREAPGAACTQDSECVGYATCNGTSCVGRPSQGETCDPYECLGDLECTGGTCQPPPDVPGCTIGG